MNRHHRSNNTHPFRINVTPEEAQWRYLSFRVLALEPGQSQQFNTEDSEMVVVPLSGEGACAFSKESFTFSRSSVFEELPDIFYVPPRSSFSLRGTQSIDFARRTGLPFSASILGTRI